MKLFGYELIGDLLFSTHDGIRKFTGNFYLDSFIQGTLFTLTMGIFASIILSLLWLLVVIVFITEHFSSAYDLSTMEYIFSVLGMVPFLIFISIFVYDSMSKMKDDYKI